MPRSLQRKKLQRMADQFQKAFTMAGLAETSFISSARFKGFSIDLIYQTAASYWPGGYAAGLSHDDWCVPA
ncbi:MAG: hypothetical protein P9L94_01875 [Candidatus Hinthialibacter antarcticus]|nr:hypothetical protein [Candidatus Hinthialibacter antarcticus]